MQSQPTNLRNPYIRGSFPDLQEWREGNISSPGYKVAKNDFQSAGVPFHKQINRITCEMIPPCGILLILFYLFFVLLLFFLPFFLLIWHRYRYTDSIAHIAALIVLRR